MWKQMWWVRYNVSIHRNTNVIFCIIWLILFRQDIIERVNVFASILYVLVLVALFTILLLALYAVQFAIDLYRMKRRRGILGEHCIELSEEGLREQTEVNDSFSRWESIDLIKANKKYIYYCIGYACLGIPKRAFETEQEAERFFRKALMLWKAKRGE